MDMKEILAIYENAGALLSGHFELSSGLHSSQYLQSALVLLDPDRAERLGKELASRFEGRADCVVSPALGGLIIGYEVARALRLPFMFTERKEGKMCLRRGFSIRPGARVVIVEDVVTTGGSVRECMEVVRRHGGLPVHVLALVDRDPKPGRFDVPFASLVQLRVPAFPPESCPLCREGVLPPVKPGSRTTPQ